MDEQSSSVTKDLIIKAAIPLFREKGFHQATLRDIAKASGIAMGTIHYHFPSKEAILESALSLNMTPSSLESIAAGPQPVEERLRRVIRLQVVGNIEQQDRFWIFHHDIRFLSPNAREAVRQGLRARRRAVERLIAEGVETGAFAVKDPAFIVTNLVRMLDSIALWYRSDGTRSPEEIADGITDLLISGLRGERSDR